MTAARRRLTSKETRRELGSASATVTFSVALDTSSDSDFSSADDLYSSVTSDLSDADSDGSLVTVSLRGTHGTRHHSRAKYACRQH